MLKMTDLNLSNQRVLIRVDLNVPIEEGKVTSAARIEAILPTLEMALKQHARILLMSHLGRPQEGQFDPNLSLAPVAAALCNLLGQPIQFIENVDGPIDIKPGQIALLENTRFWIGEKNNDAALSKRLAKLCDIFVMDAFATAHRKEASTYGVAEFAPVACAGPLLMAEINALRPIMRNPKRPLLAIVGGSKVSTKLSVLQHLLAQVDYLIVGGGIANTFIAAQGFSVGGSLYEPDLIPEAQQLLKEAKQNGKTILVPVDVRVANHFSKEASAECKMVNDINQNELILDVGEKTSAQIRDIVQTASTILWNGPLGVFEWDQFGEGTKSLAKAIAASPGYSVAGGGDTLAAIEKYHIENDISYISTGGGAFLEILEGKTLPAIAILEQRAEQNKVNHETN
jgi:phosphoglycerate kinase